jgi:hypothetical protein
MHHLLRSSLKQQTRTRNIPEIEPSVAFGGRGVTNDQTNVPYLVRTRRGAGRHAVCGRSLRGGGPIIELTNMRQVEVDAGAKTSDRFGPATGSDARVTSEQSAWKVLLEGLRPAHIEIWIRGGQPGRRGAGSGQQQGRVGRCVAKRGADDLFWALRGSLLQACPCGRGIADVKMPSGSKRFFRLCRR